jgi:DNA replication protein DnaC
MQNWMKMKSYSKTLPIPSLLEGLASEELDQRDREIELARRAEIKKDRDNAFFGCGINEDLWGCSFQNYHADSPEQKKALSAVYEFAKRVTAGQYCALVLYGNPGGGKTHLVTACLNMVLHSVKKIWNEDYSEYFTGLYIQSRSISSRLMETGSFRSKETYDDVINEFCSSDLLVIDEIGRDPLSLSGESSGLFAIIDKRKSKGKSIAMCTNCNFEELSKILGSAAMSRILQNAIVVDMSKIPDWRLSHRGV